MVRYFFLRRIPPVTSILLVESGSRRPLERAVPALRKYFGVAVRMDVLTCVAGLPQGLSSQTTTTFNVNGYRGARWRLLRELVRRRYEVLGILCSDEPILGKWKWLLAARLPAKVFVINENGDYFWLDRRHGAHIRGFIKYRAGMAGLSALRAAAAAAMFPFTLLYLLLYATAVHVRRALHRGFQ